jgi:transglutaminase-like putative cysteine protease
MTYAVRDEHRRNLTLGVARSCALLLLLWLAGCTSLYFRDAGTPPAAGLRYSMAELPFSEYWSGIVFNGAKIGYTRFSIRRIEAGRHEITAEASFVLRFLGIEKKVHLRARDVVADDLQLVEFAYDYRIDGSELLLSGERRDAMLEVTVTTGGQPVRQSLPVAEPLHPTSAIALYPVLAGLHLDREYRYLVYDGQLQKLATVEQRVLAYEASEFFPGNAFRLGTSLHGQNTTTWIDALGRPVFELALRGVLIAALEDEQRARKYVVQGVLNQREALLEFSLIKPDTPVVAPRRTSYLKVALSGLGRTPESGGFQLCREVANGHECEMQAGVAVGTGNTVDTANLPARYLQPSTTVQSQYPNIRILAHEIAGLEDDPRRRIEQLLRWIDLNIEKAPLDVFSAVDVLEKRKAECQGHAYLYAAFARALGIPTRVVNGLVYSEQMKGFLFHSWVESWIDGTWTPLDPTFGQAVADATHIKLLEGEALADLVPLIDWVGRLRIRVLAQRQDAQ